MAQAGGRGPSFAYEPRHAAALALVGWYLMAPLFTGNSHPTGDPGLRKNRPSRQGGRCPRRALRPHERKRPDGGVRAIEP
jgi:hypothetical protein